MTLDNGRDHTRPNTLGAAPCSSSRACSTRSRRARRRGEIAAVAVTGKPFILAAGADLSKVGEIPDNETGDADGAARPPRARQARPSSACRRSCSSTGSPSAEDSRSHCNADYRTIDCLGPGARAARGVPRPHPRLGRRDHPAEPDRHRERTQGDHREPLKKNRTLKGQEAFDLGIADAIFGPANFLEDSIRWADDVISAARSR